MCETIKLPSGGTAIVCRRDHGRKKKCHYCSSPATALCDFPVDGETCDRPTCGSHGRYWEGKKDVCVDHARELGLE